MKKQVHLLIVTMLSIILLFPALKLSGQSVDSVLTKAEQWKAKTLMKGLSIQAYMDVYYVGNIGGTIPTSHIYEFQSNSPFINEVRVNMFDLTLHYTNRWARVTSDIRYGDQPQLLASNSTAMWTNYISQLTMGFRIYKGLWFDCGYLESPVGVESSMPINNLLSSCTVGSYYEPSTLLGGALSYTTNDSSWVFTLWAGNPFTVPFGKNTRVMYGIDVAWNPVQQLTLSYNNALGNIAPSGASYDKYYFFNNLYATWNPSPKWNFIAQTDLALQKMEHRNKDSVKRGLMVSALLGAKYWILPKFSLALRGEMFYDPENMLITDHYTGKTNQFMIYGFSAGLEFKPFGNSYIRFQYSYLTSGDPGVKPFNQVTAAGNSYWADYYRQCYTITTGIMF